MSSYHDDLIDQIQAVRSKNNKNWMDLLRLAFKHAPDEAAAIMAEIYREDSEISSLAKKLTQYAVGDSVIIRKAKMDDARVLFDWMNDPITRAMSRNTDELVWTKHVSWLERRLERNDSGLYICEMNGTPVGTFRLDDDEISYTVAPEHRGKGIATAILIAAKKQFGVKKAKIKPDNTASIRAATKAGHIVVLLE